MLPGILHQLKSSVIGLSASLLGVILPGSGAVIWAAEVNAVGYVNVDYRQGYELIADPLRSEANRVDQVLPSVAENTQLAKFAGGNWVTNEFVAGSWTIPEMTLSPGEAAVLRSPAEWPHTWAGSILQGDLKVLIPAGGSVRSSLVPQAGKLSEVLQFPKIVGTKIYRVDNNSGQLVLRATCTGAGWEPEEPVLNVGEGFYVEAMQEFVWNRAFVVNGNDSPAATAIRIVAQPQRRQMNLGDTISLSVEAASTNKLFYQWQLNGNDIPGATDPTLTIARAGRENLGSYWVNIWDHRSWVWSDITRVELVSSGSPRLAINQDSQGRGVLLVSQGTSGRKAAIEFSSDLVNWADLGGAEQIDSNSVLDRFSGQQSERFYRLRLE